MNEESSDKKLLINYLLQIERIVFNLNKENIEASIKSTFDYYNPDFEYSFNLIICQLISLVFCSPVINFDVYLEYIKRLEGKEDEIMKNQSLKIINLLTQYSIKQSSYFLIQKLYEQKLISPDVVKNIDTIYFAHLKTKKQLKKYLPYIEKIPGYFIYAGSFDRVFFDNYEELSKNDWELHKQYIKEGHNPNEIAKIIRNDEIEKLQEISSQTNFDFNQTIEPSLYERCDFINNWNVSLIDYAAFFSAIKCFKFLLLNGANIRKTGKYAVAGGNEEIIHLCEQNNSSFDKAYKAAIEFHRNDIFKYLYEDKINKIDNLENFGKECILYNNYEILSYLEKYLDINDSLINLSIQKGNLFLTKYFLVGRQIQSHVLFTAIDSKNVELFKFILEQKGIDINFNKNSITKTPLAYACEVDCIEIVALLLEQEGIDIKIKGVYFLIFIFVLNKLFFIILCGIYSYVLIHYLCIYREKVIVKLCKRFLIKMKLILMLRIFICFIFRWFS